MQGTLFILQPIAVEENRVIDFWASQYRYSLEHLYETNISVKPFTDDAIRNLFEWRNGSKLSERNTKSIERNYILQKENEFVKRAMQFSQEAGTEEAEPAQMGNNCVQNN